MNPEVKAKWLSALRSGEYAQTKEVLQSDEGFCCLGVLCDIAVKDGIIEAPEANYGIRYYIAYDYDDVDEVYPFHEESQLPWKVARWAGLDSRNPSVEWSSDQNGSWTPVSEPNDSGATFEEIADLIERDL